MPDNKEDRFLLVVAVGLALIICLALFLLAVEAHIIIVQHQRTEVNE